MDSTVRFYPLGGEFKIPKAARPNCRPCLVRIGANCDHAQGRRGPITYLTALEVPEAIHRVQVEGQVRPPASEWTSPVFVLDGINGPFSLLVNTRYPMTVPPALSGPWQVRYRLREQLCMHLVAFAASYASRPGIVQLPV